MPTESGKKIIILYILQILRRYTDADHTMTQQQIAEKLRDEYGLEVNRATVKRNIADLIDAGYDIQYTEVVRTHTDRKTGEKEENTVYTNLYFEHEFTEPELHMLIDGLLFSRSVPYKQRKQLIDKLGKLSSAYFNQRMNHVHCMSADSPQNPELFHTIDILDEAITAGKQVEITYNYYGTDMKLHPGMNADGTVKRQTLNPYQMVASEGRYYLICNNDHHDTVSNYRIDRITDIALLETPVKPKSQVEGLEDGLNLQDYVYQNLNMFSGKAEKVEFVTAKGAVSLIIDFFGRHVSFHEQEDGKVSCRLLVSTEAMKHWAVEHANIVRVVSPASLVEDIRTELRKAAALYEMNGNDE
ncbi:WYL domain-containing transcriptional regulator [Clostridiales bacterium]|nr:WYL domain-containing transcriptional regulator [Clostridiales bacterium]